MSMTRRKATEPTARWSKDPNKAVVYSFDFRGIEVKPGMKFRLKNDRNIYTFHCLVTNIRTGAVWIECTSPEGFFSFRPERVFKLEGIKRSYKKNVN